MQLERLSRQHPAGTSHGTVLFIHGACMGAWVWENNFFEYFFAKGYDVCAISLRNHFGSEHDGRLKWTSIMDYEEDLKQAIDQIEGRVFLVGHSMGGFTIQHHFKRMSPKVAGAILLCSAPNHGLWRFLSKVITQYPLHFIHSLFAMSWLPIMSNRQRLKNVMFSANFPDQQMDGIVNRLQDESFLAFLQMAFLKLPAKKVPAIPLMIIGGEKDYLISEKDTRQMAASYHITPLIVPQGTHCLMLEQGWELVAEQINAFFSLQKNSP
jgi:pimeloyl-ACP methyl ester carboxylesterase